MDGYGSFCWSRLALHFHWHVTRSCVLQCLPSCVTVEAQCTYAPIPFLLVLLLKGGREMLRHLLKEVPGVVPALVRGMDDPDCNTREERLECLEAMVTLAGPEERALLIEAGAPKALVASMT